MSKKPKTPAYTKPTDLVLRSGEVVPDALPPGCFRCDKCGRPWINEQAFAIKDDVLCFPCYESFQMAVMNALHQAQRDAYWATKEKAKIDKAMDA
jgi:hypothetical protein